MLKLLNTFELARRWSLHHQTLINWRSLHKGPPFVRLGVDGPGRRRRVRYMLADIVHYEKTVLKQQEKFSWQK